MTILSFLNRNSHLILTFQSKRPTGVLCDDSIKFQQEECPVLLPLAALLFAQFRFFSSLSSFSPCPICLWYLKFELEPHFPCSTLVVGSVYYWLLKKTGPSSSAEVSPVLNGEVDCVMWLAPAYTDLAGICFFLYSLSLRFIVTCRQQKLLRLFL